MPTYDRQASFVRDYRSLTAEQRRAFRRAITEFVTDLSNRPFRPGLRVKRVQTHPGVWEMTWAPDGRATFHFGTESSAGNPHIVWRRIGTHEIFSDP